MGSAKRFSQIGITALLVLSLLTAVPSPALAEAVRAYIYQEGRYNTGTIDQRSSESWAQINQLGSTPSSSR